MGGRHPGTAVHGGGDTGPVAEPLEALPQLCRGQKPPVGLQIARGGCTHSAWNMAGPGIHGFEFAAVPLPCPGIKEQSALTPGSGLSGVDRGHGALGQGDVPGCGLFGSRGQFVPGGAPGGQAAVEQVNGTEAGVAQHPPQPRGSHIAAVVVRHHGVAVVDAPAARGLLELLRRRQRMPSAARFRRSGEFGGEVHEDGSGDVFAQIVVVTMGVTQRPANIEEHCAPAGFAGAVQLVLQGSCVDEGVHAPTLSSASRRPGRL